MYWRIRKIGPEQIARQYGVHAVLIVSLIFNVAMFTRVAATSKALPSAIKTDFEKFARDVTSHLFDANYLTVEGSMVSLKSELHQPVYDQMVRIGLIPPSPDELRAVVRQMDESKSVSCIKFDEVKLVNEPGPTTPAVMSVKCFVIVHDSQGVRPAGFSLQYTLGTHKGDNKPVVIKAVVQEAPVQQAQPSGT